MKKKKSETGDQKENYNGNKWIVFSFTFMEYCIYNTLPYLTNHHHVYSKENIPKRHAPTFQYKQEDSAQINASLILPIPESLKWIHPPRNRNDGI